MMRLPEFEKEYCQDILDKVIKMKDAGFTDNSYDDIIQDEETGRSYRVIYVADGYIKVDDIFELDLEDFKAKYKDDEYIEARSVYLKPYLVLSGRNALRELSMAMEAEAKHMQQMYRLQKELEDADSKPDEEGSAMARRLYSGGW